jgi:hypothetical protein
MISAGGDPHRSVLRCIGAAGSWETLVIAPLHTTLLNNDPSSSAALTVLFLATALLALFSPALADVFRILRPSTSAWRALLLLASSGTMLVYTVRPFTSSIEACVAAWCLVLVCELEADSAFL